MAIAATPAVAAAAPADVSVPPVPLPPLPAGTAPAVSAPAARAAGRCRGAGARHASHATMRAAVVCLINQQRARSGRGGLGANARLARAAGRHAADMVRRHYFGHFSPSGRSPLSRARGAGWRGNVGEMIAWGCGALATPRATVRAWMASPPHRAIMLGPGHAVGIGFKRARGCGGRIYWVADIG